METETLERWLRIDSTTGREAEFLRELEEHFEALNLECRRQSVADDRWNLVAEATSDPSLLFSTHVDTVPPHLDVDTREDRIAGRGACDTKGGLFSMVRAARRLLDDGLDDVGFLLVVGEEVDHCGAKRARDLDLSPDRILLCEPTRNDVVAGQKGMVKLEVDAEGRAGHSAFPDEGVSAIHRLLAALEDLQDAEWPTNPTLGDTTLNVGVLEGGVAANVFAPSARAEVLFRTVSPTDHILERVDERIGAHPGVSFDVVTSNDPLEFDPPADVPTHVVPFNTDAPYLVELGPVWLVGPGDIRVAHSDGEHVTYDALRNGIDRYEDLARRVVGG